MNFDPQLDALQNAIRITGAFIRKEYEGFDRDRVEIKGRNDLVSYVDRTAEEQLVSQLQRLTPGCGFINEESGRHRTDSPQVWIIDPLDGTTNFVYGVPVFSISVALKDTQDGKEEIVLGCVYDVMRDELFHARKGHGAYLNGKRIAVGTAETLETALIAYGAMHSKHLVLADFLQMLGAFMQRSRGLRRLGSAALDLAYTAAGRFDGFFEAQLHPWDVAAGSLLVQEAGGHVSDFFGGPDYLFGRSILAGNTRVHQEMQDLLGGFIEKK